MQRASTSRSGLVAFGRQVVATGALCGAFVTITVLSFAAAVIGLIRHADPPDDD